MVESTQRLIEGGPMDQIHLDHLIGDCLGLLRGWYVLRYHPDDVGVRPDRVYLRFRDPSMIGNFPPPVGGWWFPMWDSVVTPVLLSFSNSLGSTREVLVDLLRSRLRDSFVGKPWLIC